MTCLNNPEILFQLIEKFFIISLFILLILLIQLSNIFSTFCIPIYLNKKLKNKIKFLKFQKKN
jgi:hypothetical protein